MDQTGPGIGHNRGPGTGWQLHCWKRARKALVGTVPLEIVRMRMKRAKELGLAYPEYAAILTGTGRDVVGFLFTAEGLRLRLARELEMPAEVREKLSGLIRCRLLALAPEAEAPAAFRAELEVVSGLDFAAAGKTPGDGADWSRAREAILSVLGPLKLPADGVVLVGSKEEEAGWAVSARMARFLTGSAYFQAAETGVSP